jgi:cytochrome o ubiquinol oxidase subunit 3
VLFAGLFATYAVLQAGTFGGPNARALFDGPFVLIETLVLLISSFTCGLALVFFNEQKERRALTALGLTFVLGLSFLYMELHEFVVLVQEGVGWWRSGFLSSYFTLVGTHGLHIAIGLIWMCALFLRVVMQGMSRASARKMVLLSLFWHFLDIVWIFIFTVVYLLGAV